MMLCPGNDRAAPIIRTTSQSQSTSMTDEQRNKNIKSFAETKSDVIERHFFFFFIEIARKIYEEM